MNLLMWSIIVSFGNMFSIKFIPMFVTWFLDYNHENKKILSEISFLKNQQSEISIVREFAKHAKLQRRINKLNEQLKIHIRESTTKNLKIKFSGKVLLYIFSIILHFIFIYYNYRQTVLNELPSDLFSPLTWLVSWPLSQAGTMSFVFWYSITNCVAKVAINNIF